MRLESRGYRANGQPDTAFGTGNWYGETMIRHARIALSSLREAGQEVDALKTGLSGHVCLGAITGPALSLIPQAIMTVARENPKLLKVMVDAAS